MNRKGGAIPGAVLGALALLVTEAAPAIAGVNVNINIGPPAVVVSEPPEMVVVPQSMVYFAPGVSVDLLFFEGFWWTPKDGRWFRARAYDGPWTIVGPRYVPREIVHLPPGYRGAYARGAHIPYGQLKKHWRHREIERREHRGEWRRSKEARHEVRNERREREQPRDRRDGEREHRGNGHGRGR
ncbi:MAG: hypothetical protein ACM3NF_04280 [Gemmatimonadota bacterium]